MNKIIKSIVDELDRGMEEAQMDLEYDKWRQNIPGKPGWYLIKTNTPVEVLMKCTRIHKAHINIPETIKKKSKLSDVGIAIIQSGDAEYIVYNGEANNLKARAREHAKGHPQTYCLGLSDYMALRNYRWTFCYVPASEGKSLPDGDKTLRTAVEQAWRAKHGWPILCSK